MRFLKRGRVEERRGMKIKAEGREGELRLVVMITLRVRFLKMIIDWVEFAWWCYLGKIGKIEGEERGFERHLCWSSRFVLKLEHKALNLRRGWEVKVRWDWAD